MGIYRPLRRCPDHTHNGLADKHREMEGQDGIVARAWLRGMAHRQFPQQRLQPLLCDQDIHLLDLEDTVQ